MEKRKILRIPAEDAIKDVLHLVGTRKLRGGETRRSITHVADAADAEFAGRDSMTTFLSFKRSNGHAHTRFSRHTLAFLVSEERV